MMADSTPNPPAAEPTHLRVASSDTPARTPGVVSRWFRGWSRDRFSPERMIAFAKSLLWVGPLTALIWIYAERQQQVRVPNVTVPIEVVSSDPSKFIRVTRPNDGNVMVTVQGPNAAIAKLVERSRMAEGNPRAQIRLDREAGGATGGGTNEQQRLTIPAIRLGSDSRFIDAGITVVGAQPEGIEVLVENYKEVDVTVKARTKDESREVVFQPPTVRVRAPGSMFRDAEASVGGLVALADVVGRIDPNGSEEQVLTDVKLFLPSALDPKFTTLSPTSVTARVKATGLKEYVIPTVLVRVAPTDPATLNEFTFDPVPPLYNVRVVGTDEQIKALSAPNAPAPEAFAKLRANPTAGENEADVVTYVLPPGVTVKEAPKTVKVTLQRR